MCRQAYPLRSSNYEAHLSAQQGTTDTEVRFPGPNEDEGRATCSEAQTCKGTDQAFRFRREEAVLVAAHTGGDDIPDERFPKSERIRKSIDIRRVFAEGARYSCKGMRLHVLPNSLGVARAVFVPVRSYENAVTRNKAKRLLRECWRLGKRRLYGGHDVAIVLYPGADSYDQRNAQLGRLLKQAGLIIERS